MQIEDALAGIGQEGIIDEIIDSIEIRPVGKRNEHAYRASNTMWVSHPFFREIAARCSVPTTQLHDTLNETRHPSFYVKCSPALLDCIDKIGLIYGNKNPEQDYFLELLDNNRLFFKYNRILGSHHLGTLTIEQVERLKSRMAGALAEREGIQDQAQAPASAKPAPTKDAPADPVLAEIALLKREGNRLLLGQETLVHYAQIKSIMQKAGGKYARNGFTFTSEAAARDAVNAALGGKSLNIKKDTQFFATPPAEARALFNTLALPNGARILEPSAGDGALASVATQAGCEVVTIENWDVNVKALKGKGYAPIEEDFLKVSPADTGLFDAVLMNPPFAKRQDLAHVRHALGFLAPHGELAAIISPSFLSSSIKDAKNFKELMDLAEAQVTPIEAGAFKTSGTGVSTLRIKINMETLVHKLGQLDKDPADYGLDLSHMLAADFDGQFDRPTPHARLKA